ncbi:hypothetical protein WJX72_005948 [[Myrmecia] bisecta]|uniref:C3H1-type domain-containing protein n=1 Tax=[Myrmecia] bisecta TaxID=41462 RepID=A0AAW1PCQ4_9CHLO
MHSGQHHHHQQVHQHFNPYPQGPQQYIDAFTGQIIAEGTDDYFMFVFKVQDCDKKYVHDWRSCPFKHKTENARRRDPRIHRYFPEACPDYKSGYCVQGETCRYAHGVYECWLHPTKYRTQICKDGAHCSRTTCFFAHHTSELRDPDERWRPELYVGGPEYFNPASSPVSVQHFSGSASPAGSDQFPYHPMAGQNGASFMPGLQAVIPQVEPAINHQVCHRGAAPNAALLAMASPRWQFERNLAVGRGSLDAARPRYYGQGQVGAPYAHGAPYVEPRMSNAVARELGYARPSKNARGPHPSASMAVTAAAQARTHAQLVALQQSQSDAMATSMAFLEGSAPASMAFLEGSAPASAAHHHLEQHMLMQAGGYGQPRPSMSPQQMADAVMLRSGSAPADANHPIVNDQARSGAHSPQQELHTNGHIDGRGSYTNGHAAHHVNGHGQSPSTHYNLGLANSAGTHSSSQNGSGSPPSSFGSDHSTAMAALVSSFGDLGVIESGRDQAGASAGSKGSLSPPQKDSSPHMAHHSESGTGSANGRMGHAVTGHLGVPPRSSYFSH